MSMQKAATSVIVSVRLIMTAGPDIACKLAITWRMLRADARRKPEAIAGIW